MPKPAALLGIVLGTALTSVLWAQPPGPPQLEISEIRDGLYKVTTGPRVSPVLVFLATDDGIVVVDPPNPAATSLLQDELDARLA